MSTTLQLPDSVKDAPASARLVYAALQADGPLTRQELIERTGAARRTVNAALATLRDRELAEARPDPTDERRRLYTTAESPVHNDA